MIIIDEKKIAGAYLGNDKINTALFLQTAPSNCMYDNVLKKFFENKGSGQFIYGINSNEPYLKGALAQYIDTVILPNQNTKVEIKFEFDAANPNYRALIGSFFAADTRFFLTCIGGAGNINYQFQTTNSQTVNLPFGQKHKITISRSGVYVNGVFWNSVSQTAFANERSLYLFAGNNLDFTPGQFSDAKIYTLKIWQDDVLIQDLMPVYVGQKIENILL